ncbi:glycoprotein [Muir Springs virus]|uniref:Glycoprotein n=1 Tax=Muir Springs virus TaxID=932700 RepID=A0A0D3R1G0_9RHAB|nr:glycoprotein [Muir Springs virus]AJR28337.1 glycoprotein [Muir Springs virus]
MATFNIIFVLISFWTTLGISDESPHITVTAPETPDPILLQGDKTYLFLVPSESKNWKPADLNELSCPPLISKPDTAEMEYMSTDVMELQKHHELAPVQGYLCSGLRYKVICSEGFFGQKTITKKIENLEPDQNKCVQDLEKFINDDYLLPYFPSEDCNWMKETPVHQDFIVYQKHQVKYDPYHNGFYDALFKKDFCQEKICETEHDQTIWITNQELKQECTFNYPVKKHVFYKRDYSKMIIDYEINQWTSVEDGCLIRYCGQEGIRLSNGMFFVGKFYKLISNLPICPEGTKISYKPIKAQLDEIENEIILNQERLLCLDSIRQMTASKKLSFYSLSFLEPKSMSRHKVYRIHNNTLEYTETEWEPIVAFNFNGKNQIGVNKEGKEVYWNEWVPSGKDGLLSGFNGVYKKVNSSKISISRLETIKEDYEREMMIDHELVTVEHPKIVHLKRENITGSRVEIVNTEHSDVSGWFSSVLKSFWGKLMMTVVSIIIIIIIGLLIINCGPIICKTCISSYKKKKSRRDRFRADRETETGLRRQHRVVFHNNETDDERAIEMMEYSDTPRTLRPIPDSLPEPQEETTRNMSHSFFNR